MTQQPRHGIPESLRQDLLHQIAELESTLQGEELRSQIRSLASRYIDLPHLNSMPSPLDDDSIVMDRLLAYFLRFPRSPISKTELMLVAGRDDWAYLVRKLRVKRGWPIVRGIVIWHMQAAGELPNGGAEFLEIDTNDYILVDTMQDYAAAYRGYVARDLRRERGDVRSKLLDYFRGNPGRRILGDELRQVANYTSRWARYVCELRSDLNLPIGTKYHGRPDLPVGVYVLV